MRMLLTSTLAGLALGTAAIPALATDYHIDPTHTFASFEIDHFGASMNHVRFDKVDGKISFDPDEKSGAADITIAVDSLNHGVAPFESHLKGDDMFDAAQYPNIRFVSDEFVFDGDQVSEVKGDLTIKGKTHPVTLKARQFNCYDSPMLKREVCGGIFDATVDRTQWGLDYGLDMVAGKDVRLVAQIEAARGD